MNQELPPGQDPDEIESLTRIVAESLAKGDDPRAVAGQLIDSGWDEDQANAFVGSIHQHVSQQPHASGGSEARGWLLWIGVIGGINFLSWMFNWGFWIY